MFRDDHGCKRFVGKNAIVTAGTMGIGLAMAHRLLSEGARVFICSRKPKNVDDAVRELCAKYGKDACAGVPCNVSKPGDLELFIEKAVAWFGPRIDALVSNVGVNPAAMKALDVDDKSYDKVWDANVRSHWRLCKLAKPFLVSGSSILLISSNSAYAPSFPLSIYATSKLGLVGLGKALAQELGAENIRCNVLAPGLVRTKMAEMLWKSDDVREGLKERSFLGRISDPEDMVGTAAFLLSNDARQVSGECIVVSVRVFFGGCALLTTNRHACRAVNTRTCEVAGLLFFFILKKSY